jgi:hypothetical protein
MKLSQSPTYLGFASECIVPYLFSISYKFKYGELPFGELRMVPPVNWPIMQSCSV